MASQHTITSQFTGDTFAGLVVTVYEDAAKTTVMDLTGASVRMDFRNSGKLSQQLASGSGVEITDAAGGVITASDFVISMAAGVHKYDVQVTKADGAIVTVLYGTFTVLQDQTR